MFCPPLIPDDFEFGRREIAESRMDSLVLVYLLDPVASTGRCEVPDLGVGVGEILVVRQVHLLFLDGLTLTSL